MRFNDFIIGMTESHDSLARMLTDKIIDRRKRKAKVAAKKELNEMPLEQHQNPIIPEIVPQPSRYAPIPYSQASGFRFWLRFIALLLRLWLASHIRPLYDIINSDECLSIQLPIPRKKPRKHIRFEVGKYYSGTDYSGRRSRTFLVLKRYKHTYNEFRKGTRLLVKCWGDGLMDGEEGNLGIYDHKDSDSLIIERANGGLIALSISADRPDETTHPETTNQVNSKPIHGENDNSRPPILSELSGLSGMDYLNASDHNKRPIRECLFPEALEALLLTASKKTIADISASLGILHVKQASKLTKKELAGIVAKHYFQRKKSAHDTPHVPSKGTNKTGQQSGFSVFCNHKGQFCFTFE